MQISIQEDFGGDRDEEAPGIFFFRQTAGSGSVVGAKVRVGTPAGAPRRHNP